MPHCSKSNVDIDHATGVEERERYSLLRRQTSEKEEKNIAQIPTLSLDNGLRSGLWAHSVVSREFGTGMMA